MKIIKCDLCKRELGKQVDIGNFIGWGSGTQYKLSDFDNGFCIKEKTISDLCSECYIKISEAQNKAIKEIINNPLTEESAS